MFKVIADWKNWNINSSEKAGNETCLEKARGAF